ncbi:MAG: hypothetical protein HC817_05130 [Saprospiraceae bacterium]|nr:hypothetical protein [Saprospiraceae bacterium]
MIRLKSPFSTTKRINAAVSQTRTACAGENRAEAIVVPSGGNTPYTYRWSNTQTTDRAINLGAIKYFVTVTDANGCKKIDSVSITAHDSLRLTLDLVDPTCFAATNGSARVLSTTGGGGNGNVNNYNITWNTTPIQNTIQAINLIGNKSYTVTVTDTEGCRATTTIVLNQPDPVSLTGSSVATRCFGSADGSATVQGFGTNPPFRYQWDSGANNANASQVNNLAAGRYSVTIFDGNDCPTDTVITVNQPANMRVQNTQIKTAKCNDDSTGRVAITVVGGTPTYRYRWSNGSTTPTIENLRAARYRVTITDAQDCQMEQEFNVRGADVLDVDMEVKPIKCYGENNGIVILDAFGGTPPYKYSTNGVAFTGVNKIGNLRAGNYEVFVKDVNDCIWKDTFTLTQPPRFYHQSQRRCYD